VEEHSLIARVIPLDVDRYSSLPTTPKKRSKVPIASRTLTTVYITRKNFPPLSRFSQRMAFLLLRRSEEANLRRRIFYRHQREFLIGR